jgi:hypothetical protein
MYSLIQLKTLVSCGRDSARPLGRGFLLIPLVLVCFAFLPQVQAAPDVTPPPDGVYGGSTAEGYQALQHLTTGAFDTAIGWRSLYTGTTFSFDTGVGAGTLALDTAGVNTATGAGALLLNTTGTRNTSNGARALIWNSVGSDNTAVGDLALANNGHNASGNDGISNTAVGSGALFSNVGGANNHGSFNGAFGDDALALNTDGFSNNAFGDGALYANVHAAGNTAVGDLTLTNNDSTGNNLGNLNTGVGAEALVANTDGDSNNAIGFSALDSNTVGVFNQAMGVLAMHSNVDGAANVAIGDSALFGNAHGDFNTMIGDLAGAGVEGTDDIYIGATSGAGVTSESNTIRIGDPLHVLACYIAGINASTSSGGVPVYVNGNGKLGTVTSSARFKDDIKPMDKASESILALKPVTFRYKKDIDANRIPQFGLVAEEVAKVNPDLVVLDRDGKPYTVRYEAVNAMLLNEFLKEHRTMEKQQATIGLLEAQVKTLTASLNEQATQIQKVSAQLEMIRPTPQVVENR